MESQHVRKTLAHRVRQFREQRGYSQEVFADLVGLNRSYLGSIERAEHNIGAGLGVTVGRLLEPGYKEPGLNTHRTGS